MASHPTLLMSIMCLWNGAAPEPSNPGVWTGVRPAVGRGQPGCLWEMDRTGPDLSARSLSPPETVVCQAFAPVSHLSFVEIVWKLRSCRHFFFFLKEGQNICSEKYPHSRGRSRSRTGEEVIVWPAVGRGQRTSIWETDMWWKQWNIKSGVWQPKATL